MLAHVIFVPVLLGPELLSSTADEAGKKSQAKAFCIIASCFSCSMSCKFPKCVCVSKYVKLIAPPQLVLFNFCRGAELRATTITDKRNSGIQDGSLERSKARECGFCSWLSGSPSKMLISESA